ncbi:MAG: 5-bromo-4-chloroindolyl phosphate hydrolysis family protein [Oscillospiraceae bacterium]|nr:5-bromo-4-chloroindolyl phosphate hydrolysis family protein [Oscillospiraceae bacterium]
MIEDIFANLARDINDSVQKVLSSQEFSDLKKTVRSSFSEYEHKAPEDTFSQQQARQQEEARRRQEEYRRQQQARQQEMARQQAEYRRQQQERQQERLRQQEAYRQRQARGWTYSDGRQQTAQPAPAPKPAVQKSEQLVPIKSGGAIFTSILGGTGTALFGVGALSSLVRFFSGFSIGNIVATSIYSALMVGSLVLMLTGVSKTKRADRFRKYRTLLRGRDFCRIADLSSAAGVSEKRTVRDLERMVEQRLLPEGYFDEKNTCIILSKDTYQQYLTTRENARRQQLEQESDPRKAALAEAQAEGSRYIWRIREINADLPEEEISRQLDQLAEICQKIFSYVEQHPEKLPDIRKFMSYYLPTTLKLLEAYRDLEQKDIRTAEAVSTRAEIKNALNNILLAFDNLYADLMKDDLMDLSADISVLETMLTQEGLMGEDGTPFSSAAPAEPEADDGEDAPPSEPESPLHL